MNNHIAQKALRTQNESRDEAERASVQAWGKGHPMGNEDRFATPGAFAPLPQAADASHYVLRLYVAGMAPHSLRAVSTVRAICEEHLQSRYSLEIIDIYQNPALAEGEQIIAAPTLIKRWPEPLCRIVGDLSHPDRVLLALDLSPVGPG